MSGVPPLGGSLEARARSVDRIRPPGPLPTPTDAISSPFSFAIFLAAGDAFTDSEDELATESTEGTEELTVCSCAFCAFCGHSFCGAEAALTFTSPSDRYATGSFTLCTEPSPTSILASLPPSVASTSIVALSVSTSKITCPLVIRSPSFTRHLTIVPSSIEFPACGISTGMTAASIFASSFCVLFSTFGLSPSSMRPINVPAGTLLPAGTTTSTSTPPAAASNSTRPCSPSTCANTSPAKTV